MAMMPLDVDLNLPASADDIDTNLELALPYEPPKTSQEPARDRAIRNSTMQPEEAGGSQRGQSTSSGASGSRSRRVSHGQRSDGGEGDDLVTKRRVLGLKWPIVPISESFQARVVFLRNFIYDEWFHDLRFFVRDFNSYDDVDTNLELKLPNELVRTSQELARDRDENLGSQSLP
ncbi:hypothetical protein Fot_24195 [Forsythia ovata]|uniref:Uncharacterized protein n=1 Tax=Forsythia ovata TaxID=205694 RepID=A0ABD1U5I5_9LAMI